MEAGSEVGLWKKKAIFRDPNLMDYGSKPALRVELNFLLHAPRDNVEGFSETC